VPDAPPAGNEGHAADLEMVSWMRPGFNCKSKNASKYNLEEKGLISVVFMNV